MKELDSDEKFFHEIMSKSKLSVPFTDFDDTVMELIDKRISKRRLISRDILLSWIFFVVGSTFGIIVTLVLPKVQQSFIGISSDKLILPFLIIFSFLILTQLDTLIDYYKKKEFQTKR